MSIDTDDCTENEMLFDRDVLIKQIDEWDMWDIIRFTYDPGKIPNELQLSVFEKYGRTCGQNLLFNSFHFHYTLKHWIQTYDSPNDTNFVFWDHIYRPHTSLIKYMLFRTPNFISDINKMESVVFFGYDEKLERFILFCTDIEIARGIHHWVEQQIHQVIPYVYLESLGNFVEEEINRQSFDDDDVEETIQSHTPPPAPVPPNNIIRKPYIIHTEPTTSKRWCYCC